MVGARRSAAGAGLVTEAEVDDLRAHAEDIDIEAALAIEREIGHDLMAEIRVYRRKPASAAARSTSARPRWTSRTRSRRTGCGWRSRGIGEELDDLLHAFAEKVRHADLVCMGFTHLQPAEPTTLGYRLAVYAQDLLIEAMLLTALEKLTTKGMRGAVGTAASYKRLVDDSGRSPKSEGDVLERFGLQAREVARKPIRVSSIICCSRGWPGWERRSRSSPPTSASWAAPAFGEVGEPFGAKQVELGPCRSSAIR